ncbi:MAG: divalent-cation tolerance protein CutA [Flavobacteriales bacterium]|nr:divalent-cation tolerance protein CutA [Flavobacteriales bacterium]
MMMVYLTFPNAEEAEQIGRILVEEGLAACVNFWDGMKSIYRWQGRVEEAGETVCIAKTSADNFEALRARVVSLHSYECPCVVAWPLSDGHAPYIDWLAASVGAPDNGK